MAVVERLHKRPTGGAVVITVESPSLVVGKHFLSLSILHGKFAAPKCQYYMEILLQQQVSQDVSVLLV